MKPGAARPPTREDFPDMLAYLKKQYSPERMEQAQKTADALFWATVPESARRQIAERLRALQ